MCLEIIEDLLMKLDDQYVGELDERAARLETVVYPAGLTKALAEFDELHRIRAREMTRVALLAGVALGRGLSRYFPFDEGVISSMRPESDQEER
ncbi:hypothetical protein D3C86_1578490 [compost metagenome]